MKTEQFTITTTGERDLTFVGTLHHNYENRKSVLLVGWSARNPEDKETQPKLAHTIASGRALKKPFFTAVFDGPKPTSDLCKMLLETAAKEFQNKIGYYIPSTRKNGKEKTSGQIQSGQAAMESTS